MVKEQDLNKPNKRLKIVGYVMFFAGIGMILLSIFWVKEFLLGLAGIIVLMFGAATGSMGKFGLEKAVENTSAVERAKAKTIAKSVAEGLKEGFKEDKTPKKDKE